MKPLPDPGCEKLVRALRWSAFAALMMLVLCAAWIWQAGRWLERPAGEPVAADLLVPLGGDSGDRGLSTADLYKQRRAPRILLTAMEDSPPQARVAIQHWRTQMLVDAGVPREALMFETESSNSWEEAQNTLALMRKHGWRRVLVVSDPPHMRRLDWTWGKVFAGSGLEYRLVATVPSWWKPDRWWLDEKSAAAVILEHIKLVYYFAVK